MFVHKEINNTRGHVGIIPVRNFKIVSFWGPQIGSSILLQQGSLQMKSIVVLFFSVSIPMRIYSMMLWRWNAFSESSEQPFADDQGCFSS